VKQAEMNPFFRHGGVQFHRDFVIAEMQDGFEYGALRHA
jgi:hypothetical protein